jgi:hypothetical protein
MARSTPQHPPRQRKTPQQRAQEALDVCTRKVSRLEVEASKLRAALATVETDLAAEETRRLYLTQHPDLTRPTDQEN